jgi:hypothetical protein
MVMIETSLQREGERIGRDTAGRTEQSAGGLPDKPRNWFRPFFIYQARSKLIEGGRNQNMSHMIVRK